MRILPGSTSIEGNDEGRTGVNENTCCCDDIDADEDAGSADATGNWIVAGLGIRSSVKPEEEAVGTLRGDFLGGDLSGSSCAVRRAAEPKRFAIAWANGSRASVGAGSAFELPTFEKKSIVRNRGWAANVGRRG